MTHKIEPLNISDYEYSVTKNNTYFSEEDAIRALFAKQEEIINYLKEMEKV